MLNQAVLVGRLVEKPREMINQKLFITLAVPRTYKNVSGDYDIDFVDVMLYKNIAENTKEYCDKGDLLGIKGRIESEVVDNKKYTIIVAEKVTFLSSKKE